MSNVAKPAIALAVTGLLALPVVAQENSEIDDNGYGAQSGVISDETLANSLRAENIIGTDIYTINREYDEDWWDDNDYFPEIDTEWEDIGEINDIILSRDGKLVGLVAEVGGWLDIGDEHVVISTDDLKIAGPSTGDYAFVTRLSEESMESMKEVDDTWGW